MSNHLPSQDEQSSSQTKEPVSVFSVVATCVVCVVALAAGYFSTQVPSQSNPNQSIETEIPLPSSNTEEGLTQALSSVVIENAGHEAMQIDISNASGTRSLIFPPCANCSPSACPAGGPTQEVLLPQGEYQVRVSSALTSSTQDYTENWLLLPGQDYDMCYYIDPGL